MSAKAGFTLTIRGCKKGFPGPQVMGILNVTPDSFFVGSRKQTEKDIAERTNDILREGGAIIDVGACSTRPGADVISEAEETRRLRYALTIVRREQPEAILSVDTFRPEAARMSVEEFGADIINDVSGGQCADMAARLKVGYILMSVKPSLRDMIPAFQKEIERLHSLGQDNIILDPGYGFGKTTDQNYEILNQQGQLTKLGLPILAGLSRKRMVWQILGTSPVEALNGTTAVNAIALLHGANILRVHDVREAVETVKIISRC